MRMRPAIFFALFISACLLTVGAAHCQQDASSELRKIVRKTNPIYPEIAKRMSLAGTVKLQATVGPDGSVKNVQPLGGSPVLIQAAQDAIYKWKFAPGKEETKETIDIKFESKQ